MPSLPLTLNIYTPSNENWQMIMISEESELCKRLKMSELICCYALVTRQLYSTCMHIWVEGNQFIVLIRYHCIYHDMLHMYVYMHIYIWMLIKLFMKMYIYSIVMVRVRGCEECPHSKRGERLVCVY